MSESEEDLVEKIVVAGGVVAGAYFLVVRPILQSLGVDPQDTATVQQINTLNPVENPFSFQFGPFQNAVQTWGGGQSIPDLVAGLKASYDALDPVPGIDFNGDAINVAIAAEAIYNAWGFFKDVDLNLINSIFGNINNQAFVSAMDAYLFYTYNTDLLTLLEKGKYRLGPINWGLNDTQVAAIINHINSLPQTL